MPELRLTLGTPTPYPGGSVVLGGTGSVDDDDDTSYVRYTLDGSGLYPPASTNYHWTPTPAAVPNYADTLTRGARLRVRAGLLAATAPTENRRLVVLDGTTFATWANHVYSPTATIAWTTQQAFSPTSTQWAKFQTGDVSVEPVGSGSSYAENLYEVELVLWWTAPSIPPPLRRYPPVTNGGSGPTRHYPRTVNRRAGGTY